jgi:hypothetical protein
MRAVPGSDRAWRRLALCAVLGGCGFQSHPTASADADPGDAASRGDDAGDGSIAAGDCLPHWLDHTVRISSSSVHEITELSSSGEDRNPWISDDGLRMYFSRDVGLVSLSDIYFTSRASRSLRFTSPGVVIPNLNSDSREGRPSLSSDETVFALSTDRDGHLDIHMTTRLTSGLGVPEAPHLGLVNTIGSQRIDPFLSGDGLRLYLASNTGPGGKLQLWIATRSAVGDDFVAPALVPGINDNALNQTDPALSRDERILVYSAYPNSETGDLRYATRSTATGSFGSPLEIPGVNTDANEFDPVLSADGCELYFASTRRDAKFHLFRADVTR